MLRDREEDRHHAPAPLYIDHLDAPLPGIPAPRCKERRPPNQLHGVMVCRPKIVKFHTLRVGHLLAASACEMEMVARHRRHPAALRCASPPHCARLCRSNRHPPYVDTYSASLAEFQAVER